MTRFLGKSATGLNATGEGDARDWRITVAAMQQRILDPILLDFRHVHCQARGVERNLPNTSGYRLAI